MPSPSQIFRAARPAFRSNPNVFTQQFARSTFRNGYRSQQNAGKRWQSTAAPAGQVSWFKRMWDSPIGLKTVHFWAPIMKWALVIAGISDLSRPAENLSLTQNIALTCTGAIWTRWCLIIKPRNILLAAVNFFLGIVGVVQVSRIVNYNMSVKGQSPKEQLQAAGTSAKETAVNLEEKAVAAVKKA